MEDHPTVQVARNPHLKRHLGDLEGELTMVINHLLYNWDDPPSTHHHHHTHNPPAVRHLG